jgi:gliding motility-associatede transport system auxiliary component
VAIANWIASRHEIKWDTTKNKQFSLSDLTVSALKNLKQPVKITGFFAEAQEGEQRARMKDLLDNYKPYSKLLDVKLIDPFKDPLLTQQYGIETNGTTVFESGKQRTTITTVSEEDVTNAILKVSGNKQPVLYFLQGHNEPSITDSDNSGYSVIVDQLKKNNYLVNELKDLAASPKIPDDCSALVVSGPRVALLEPEIKAIKDYLAKGGRVLVMDDFQADRTTAKLYEGYSVKAEDDIVVDDRYFFPPMGVSVPLIVPKQGTPVTKNFNFQMFFPLTRSLSYNKPEGSSDVFTPFAESTQFSWGETDKQNAVFEEGKDKKGPLTVGLLVSRTLEAKQEKSKPETRLAVIGDNSFAQNAFVNIPGNKQIFSNTVAWLTEQEGLIHIPPKEAGSEVMVLTSTQLNYIAIALIGVLPLAVLGTGIAVWARRKKL